MSAPHLCRAFLLLALVLFIGATAQAQKSGPPAPPEPPLGDAADKPDRMPDFGSPDREMRARQVIEAEKRQYEETVARAQEVAELGSQLLDAYKANKTVGASGVKKLDRLEKLIRKIRNDSGGQTTEAEPKDLPQTVEGLIQRVADQASELRKDVEKTPHHVVSAAMIDRANDLLNLVEHLRKLAR